jgi:tetratricopeptide (TPR) repeat protein
MGALYSLDDIRTAGHQIDPRLTDDPEWDRPFAPLGSAYYAAAHRVASRYYRELGLRKALALLDRATSRDALSRSNVLAIRGSVLQKLYAYSASVDTYREVLRLRQTSGAAPASVGEAMAELGFGLLFTLRWKQGRDLLQEGVTLMEQSTCRPGFVARGKKKYAASLFLTGNLRAARRQYTEARSISEQASIGIIG